MRQVTPNLQMDLGGITDEPSLIPNMVTNMLLLDAAAGDSTDTVARAAAAAADAKAVAAQADATTALANAATAETTAEAAATAAAAAVAAGIKVKQLSTNEMKSICAYPKTAYGEYGIDSLIGDNVKYYRYGYVINVTPKVKLVAIGAELVDGSGNLSNYTNQQIYMRKEYTQPYLRWILPSFNNQYSTSGANTVALSYSTDTNAYGVKITPSASITSGSQYNFIYTFIAMIEYTEDIDLGTDIV